MSTFNEVFCTKLYEKGQEITTDSLMGDPGQVLTGTTSQGASGADGLLKFVQITTSVMDVTITIPNPVDADFSVYRIKKPANTNNDLIVVDHNAVEFTKMYKDYEQTLTLYKRDNEWVL
jgi:hypothetical protein